jgi:hypothetical protein
VVDHEEEVMSSDAEHVELVRPRYAEAAPPGKAYGPDTTKPGPSGCC